MRPPPNGCAGAWVWRRTPGRCATATGGFARRPGWRSGCSPVSPWRARAGRPATDPDRPGRRLALAGAGGAFYRGWNPPGITLVSTDPRLDHPALAAQTLRLVDHASGWIAVGHGKGALTQALPPGARVSVVWRWGPGEQGKPNNPTRLRVQGAALVFRAGTLPQPIRPCTTGWPARALAVIAADPEATDPLTLAVRRLAIRLLDRGSADQVLITPDWHGDLATFTGDDPLLAAHTRLLVILPKGPAAAEDQARGARVLRAAPLAAYALVRADFEKLARALDFPGTKSLGQMPVTVLAQSGTLPWQGGPEQRDDPRTGITWVRVCPGTFTMGSDPVPDPMSREDERPAHPVALAGFEIARTETTNGQYRRFRPEHEPDKANDLPVVDVRWQEARDFCRWAGGDLPSEAQWEYAARAGSMTPWSFGADASRLGAFAWYGLDPSADQLEPVAGKRANPIGLYDMHGNAWEWVRDWYGPYAKDARLQIEPDGPTSGGVRVLRGGSFFFPPLFLRSALRFDFDPLVWGWADGFRCVRVPSPQH